MNWLTIMKRELKSYFTSLIAYVIIAIFLIISGRVRIFSSRTYFPNTLGKVPYERG